ncbi:hypothetical protein JHK85_040256 [Glycine max]|nr:hypothetical protein JHK86_039679 [Glycine max]KAG4965281.1 hypothetical protein JHK85_040256 [Glycine max]
MKGRRHKYGFNNNKREKAEKKRVVDDETGDKHQLHEVLRMPCNILRFYHFIHREKEDETLKSIDSLSSPNRKKGTITLTTYLRTYQIGYYVDMRKECSKNLVSRSRSCLKRDHEK